MGDSTVRNDPGGPKRILFVDDEEPVLDGLRMRLRRLGGKWNMRFVDSGARAVEELESVPADVVVTDMRMPGMDGAELLQIVSERWPEMVRIVLSGHSELQQIIRLVPYAQQYLAKPCEARHLDNVVERCLNLHGLLRQPALRAIAGRVRNLPATPRVYAKLKNILANDSVTVKAVADVVAADAAIAARVLQIVNSAFFRLARRMTGIEQAVTYLGFATIRNIALSAEVFSVWPQTGNPGVLSLDRLQSHVHATAAAAHALVAKTPQADDALLAGLLHDIGYWVLALECPTELARSLDVARLEQIPLHAAEIKTIGASHAQLGAYLLGLWGLPYSVVEAVAYHHTPEQVTQSQFDALGALVVAHALSPTDDAGVFATDLLPDPKVDAAYLASLRPPFDWTEATRRVAQSLTAEEV